LNGRRDVAAAKAFIRKAIKTMQVHGQVGARQVSCNDYVLVSGNGGILNFHSTPILSRQPSG
jgi:hypothetical protein